MDSASTLKFLEIVGHLKHVKRTGWLFHNINEPEHVTGHMYRMAMMTFLLDDSDKLNRTKCMEIALVHDLAEAIVGDITPYCGVDIDEKHRREDEAMQKITKLVGSKGNGLYELYKEYENQSSNEAKFVKELDRFDMILQAFEYEKRDNKPDSLQEFFNSTKGKFEHPLIKQLCDELNTQRSAYQNVTQNNQS